jgi:hypothetical protein
VAPGFAAHPDRDETQRLCPAGAGYDSQLVHAGTPPPLFLDDHHPRFASGAFLAWAPPTDAPDSFVFFVPGRKPMLLCISPWTTGTSRQMPNDYRTLPSNVACDAARRHEGTACDLRVPAFMARRSSRRAGVRRRQS